MDIAANILVLFMAVLHIYILVIEMWFWDKPPGLRAFGFKKDFATATKVLAANQGLYNGFLAAGLIWGLVHQDPFFGLQIQLFFLSCIFVAGIFGAITSSRKILFVQSVPSLITIIFVLFNYLGL
ncbi:MULTISPECIES: DUF1304 domain-containing protein [unclassified Psychrosphaera]|uniref:DUF1304 domain-containing protein n=1 Tax=unclassified Psychrosphaera TaxID=2641570 RepID=UPI0020907096|nr:MULTISPECIES: DUF1304 domain-containing protein [unclassified Psychrosphaera]